MRSQPPPPSPLPGPVTWEGTRIKDSSQPEAGRVFVACVVSVPERACRCGARAGVRFLSGLGFLLSPYGTGPVPTGGGSWPAERVAPKAWGAAVCPPSLPSVSRLGCVSHPAWGCSLSGRLCFLSLSPGPVATALRTVHHCWADLSAWTAETATDVGPWDGPQKARLWFPGHADRKRSRWQTLGV